VPVSPNKRFQRTSARSDTVTLEVVGALAAEARGKVGEGGDIPNDHRFPSACRLLFPRALGMSPPPPRSY
jgi:hypothetical protein